MWHLHSCLYMLNYIWIASQTNSYNSCSCAAFMTVVKQYFVQEIHMEILFEELIEMFAFTISNVAHIDEQIQMTHRNIQSLWFWKNETPLISTFLFHNRGAHRLTNVCLYSIQKNISQSIRCVHIVTPNTLKLFLLLTRQSQPDLFFIPKSNSPL